jgi:2-polyprenyl-3-methyl-5-hydroxy-6-metoxy-1,4-benzoquinol methylase
MFEGYQTETISASQGHQRSGLACPTCESRAWGKADKVRRASISRCLRCGLLGTTDFLNGITTTEGLYETSPEHHEEYRVHYLPQRLPAFERVIFSLERFRRTGRLLEIGCSYGYFLETARRAGWNAEAVEISSYACQVSRSKGFKVYQDGLRDLSLTAESFDVIAMWDVIEHLTDVEEIVKRCATLLRPGGALVARTPDARALLLTDGFMGAAYRHLAYPANTREHVFHFTPDTLSSLMTKAGLREVEIDTGGSWEEWVVSGRNPVVRAGRHLILRYANAKRWPYEFVITAVKR